MVGSLSLFRECREGMTVVYSVMTYRYTSHSIQCTSEDGTPCSSLNGNNDCRDEQRSTYDHGHFPVNPMRFRNDTPCFSLKGKNDW